MHIKIKHPDKPMPVTKPRENYKIDFDLTEYQEAKLEMERQIANRLKTKPYACEMDMIDKINNCLFVDQPCEKFLKCGWKRRQKH